MSVLVYALIAVGMLWIAPVGTLLDYAGLLTTTCMAMMAITVLAQRRRQQTRPFSMPLFPAPVVITLALAGWLIVSSALEDPVAALASAGTIAALVILRPWLTGQRSHADTTYTDRP